MMERRLLTPAEAALLLAPATGTATQCVEAGLLSLLGAQRISFEPSGLFKQSALLLHPQGARAADPLPRHLAALEQALAAFGKGDRLTSSEVLRALQKRFGHGFGGYVRDEVAPALIERNLLARRDTKWLGLFRRTIFERTSGGEALVAPLQRLMSALEELPSLRKSDPSQAIGLARSAGVLLVMSPKARRQIPRLRKLIQSHGDGAAAGAYLPMAGGGQDFELGDLSSALDAAALFEGLEAVSDFTSSADTDTSDGGGGGD